MPDVGLQLAPLVSQEQRGRLESSPGVPRLWFMEPSCTVACLRGLACSVVGGSRQFRNQSPGRALRPAVLGSEGFGGVHGCSPPPWQGGP